MRPVEAEPARPVRQRGLRIDRDQFEVEPFAQAEQPVVRSHARMLAAAGKRHAEAVFQPGGAEIEVACGKNEVVRNRQD